MQRVVAPEVVIDHPARADCLEIAHAATNRPARGARPEAVRPARGARRTGPVITGGNVYYENNVVYVDGEQYATAEEYYDEAATIATSLPDITKEIEWLSLGVFAVYNESGGESNQVLQLAVSKEGVITGMYTTTTPARNGRWKGQWTPKRSGRPGPSPTVLTRTSSWRPGFTISPRTRRACWRISVPIMLQQWIDLPEHIRQRDESV